MWTIWPPESVGYGIYPGQSLNRDKTFLCTLNKYEHNLVVELKIRVQVDWYLGDTTDSLRLLQDGSVDVAITYNDAAEKQALRTGSAIKRIYAFKVS